MSFWESFIRKEKKKRSKKKGDGGGRRRDHKEDALEGCVSYVICEKLVKC